MIEEGGRHLSQEIMMRDVHFPDARMPSWIKRFYALSTLLVGVLLTSGPVSAETWRSTAVPGQGDYTSVEVHSIGNTLFAQDSHGLYKSLDQGESWEHITNEVARVAFSENAIYVATRPFYRPEELLRSVDNGQSWQHFPLPDDYDPEMISLAEFVAENDTIYLPFYDEQQGYIKSIDGGNSWSSIYTPLNIFQIHNGTLYAENWDDGHLNISTDGGINWEDYGQGIDLEFYQIMPSLSFDGNAMYAQIYDSWTGNLELYKREHSAAAWQQVPLPFETWNFIYSLHDNTLYVVDTGNSPFIFKSADDGESWQQIGNTPPPGEGYLDSLHVNDQAIYVHMSYPYPHLSFYKSTDEGTSWTSAAPVSPMKTGVTTAEGDNVYVVGTVWDDTGEKTRIYKSTDRGNTWSVSNTSFDDSPSDFISLSVFGSTLYAATYGNIYKSTDSGENWSLILGNGNLYITSFAAENDTLFFSGDDYNNYQSCLFKSTDGGNRWECMTQDFPYASVAFTGNTVYVVTQEGQIYKSVTGGISWFKLDTEESFLAYSDTMTLANANTLYVNGGYWDDGNYHGGVYFTADGGNTWTLLSAPGRVISANGPVVYALDGASQCFDIHKSVDGGLSWESANAGLPTCVPVWSKTDASNESRTTDWVGTHFKDLFVTPDGDAYLSANMFYRFGEAVFPPAPADSNDMTSPDLYSSLYGDNGTTQPYRTPAAMTH